MNEYEVDEQYYVDPRRQQEPEVEFTEHWTILASERRPPDPVRYSPNTKIGVWVLIAGAGLLGLVLFFMLLGVFIVVASGLLG